MDQTAKTVQHPLGTLPEGFVYRDQNKRYPWWVKSVDRVITEIDESAWDRKVTDKIQTGLYGDREAAKKGAKMSIEKLSERLRNEVPGNQLKDIALHYASTTFFAAGVSMFETET